MYIYVFSIKFYCFWQATPPCFTHLPFVFNNFYSSKHVKFIFSTCLFFFLCIKLFYYSLGNATMVEASQDPQPNTALMSLILMLGTFIIAFKLKKFRNSKYLGRGVSHFFFNFFFLNLFIDLN